MDVRPAVQRDEREVCRLMGDFAGVRSSRKRCLKVARVLIRAAVVDRRKGRQADFAFVAVDDGGRVRGFAAGDWGWMHDLFEDCPVMRVTHIGGKAGCLRPLLRRLRAEAAGAAVLVSPVTQPPFTADAGQARRLDRALDLLGMRPVATVWAMGG